MNTTLKWIGGASAALVLVFSGASLAGALMDGDADPGAAESRTASLETAIPVDPARIDGDAQTAQPTRRAANMADAEKAEAAVQAAASAETAGTGGRTSAADDDTLVVKRILDIKGPLKYGEWYWDAEGVPPGKLVVTVDLDARVVSVFQGGYEIGTAVAMLGTPEHPTPLGTFPIISKERHNISEKYNNAPMPWTLRLTRAGIAVHGGSVVENGYASHGCIAVPDELASRLFAIAKRGDKVIITRGKTLDMGGALL